MMPPICEICRSQTGCDAVRFADHAPLPPGLMGHPTGLIWLCDRHRDAGQALAHLPSHAALAQLRSAGQQRGWLRRLLGR